MVDAQSKFNKGHTTESFEAFGAAMHTYMDNRSPEHTGFQIYDNQSSFLNGVVKGIGMGPIGAIVSGLSEVATDQGKHVVGEHREPTTDEMNLMVDEIRTQYRNVYGDEQYRLAVSESERKATEARILARQAK
jgi:hypothetical protein